MRTPRIISLKNFILLTKPAGIALVALILFAIPVPSYADYVIPDNWFRVTLRSYMDSEGNISEESRISIDGVFDETDNLICEEVINSESIAIYAPVDSELVEFENFRYIEQKSITIKYKSPGNWEIEPFDTFYCGYAANVTNPSPPDPGVYEAWVIFPDDSFTQINSPDYPGPVELPFVNVNTLRINYTNDGFYIYWQNPDAGSVAIDIGPSLEIYDESGVLLLGELYYRNTLAIEYLWFSNDYLADFDPIGDIILRFQLRTQDGLNRTYSKRVKVDDILEFNATEVISKIDTFLVNGDITNEGLAGSLVKKFTLIDKDINQGRDEAAINKIGALINQLEAQIGRDKAAKNKISALINRLKAQKGKHITVEAAEDLISEARFLLEQLQ